MIMDSEDNTMNNRPERPQLALRTSPTLFQASDTVGNLHTQSATPSIPRHTYGTRYSEKIQASVIPPFINILQATPVHANAMHHPQPIGHDSGPNELMYSVPQPSTPPPSSPVPMAISPTISFSQVVSPMTSKRRVVFGPRANCEKCKAGERHFIHFE
ncbi:hypothetical protein GALMADRAFT_90103 [Galerina marginata CBS 339.88]|uniref:Uncharacterized protein n=1 Tax=Galerina marginata (strain CBS 339.88) TaxID=685588 RepID=A0A067THF3_GALM3|nr:hypothetical protein GALMADRAFT_90103 [Galerina marginata CBS 339.88]